MAADIKTEIDELRVVYEELIAASKKLREASAPSKKHRKEEQDIPVLEGNVKRLCSDLEPILLRLCVYKDDLEKELNFDEIRNVKKIFDRILNNDKIIKGFLSIDAKKEAGKFSKAVYVVFDRYNQPKITKKREAGNAKKEAPNKKEQIIKIIEAFLTQNGISEIRLGHYEIGVKDIAEAALQLVKYFGLEEGICNTASNILFNMLYNPKSRFCSEESLIKLLLEAGRSKSTLAFPYLNYFPQRTTAQKIHLMKGAPAQEALAHRFHYIIFHLIISMAFCDSRIKLSEPIWWFNGILEKIAQQSLFFTGHISEEERKQFVKALMFNKPESHSEFNPEIVYNAARAGENLFVYFDEKSEGKNLEAKEELIAIEALAKQIVAFMNSPEKDAIIILGVPEVGMKGDKDGVLSPNAAEGFSKEDCLKKIGELEAFLYKNIVLINSNESFNFEQIVQCVLVPLSQMKQKGESCDSESPKYCLLLKVNSQNYLSALKDIASAKQEKKAKKISEENEAYVYVYVREYDSHGKIESRPIGDEKTLKYFLHKEILSKEENSKDIRILRKERKALHYLGYFAHEFHAKDNDADIRAAMAILYIAKIFVELGEDALFWNGYFLYNNLLRLCESRATFKFPEKVDMGIRELHGSIIERNTIDKPMFKQFKEVLRKEKYIPPKITVTFHR